MARILVLEDQKEMSHLLELMLGELGHAVVAAGTVQAADSFLAAGGIDLATVDLGLPDGSGLDFCRRAATSHPKLPLIVLTSETSSETVVEAFRLGARDYLRKPIDPAELRARLRGHLRQALPGADDFELAGLRVAPLKQKVTYQGKPIELTGRQIAILAVFLRHPEIVVTRESLISQLGRELEIYDRTVDSHISQLRSRLRDQGVNSISIKAVYGVGYRLET